MYIARTWCESQPAVGSSGLNARWSWVWAIELKVFSLILRQSFYQRAFSPLEIRLQTILHSEDEDNLSPLDSKIACLCQSIEINKLYFLFDWDISYYARWESGWKTTHDVSLQYSVMTSNISEKGNHLGHWHNKYAICTIHWWLLDG